MRLLPLRGILSRGWLSAIILVIAVVAVAAAAAGPTYYAAAQQSILRDALQRGGSMSQGVEVSLSAALTAGSGTAANVEDHLRESPGADLFERAVLGLEIPYAPSPSESSVLASRDGLCAHLSMVAGHCPSRAGDVVVSDVTARRDGYRVGDPLIAPPVHATLTVVGIYIPKHPNEPYWMSHGYFAHAAAAAHSEGQTVDAVFTGPTTMARPGQYGTIDVDLVLKTNRLTPGRERDLRHALATLRRQPDYEIHTTSTIENSLDEADHGSSVLRVPVVVITAEMLLLVWLLLYLLITEAAEARGRDVALAKLRGLGRRRTLLFALGEPVTLLVLALPLGILAAYLATLVLARTQLRPDTPVTMSMLGIAGAVVAVSGGLLAALVAARRVLSRDVLDQWQHTGQEQGRGWALDLMALVASGAALVQLKSAGALGGSQSENLALLAPGLIGLTVAILASRLLPVLCRSLFGPTRRRGDIALFLAVRQLARRPSGLRTMTVLSTAFALTTFAIATFEVAVTNIHDVAGTQVGAPAVLTVEPAPDEDLATAVDRLDPGGREAMAVDTYVDSSTGTQTVAVDPQRWARLTFWRPDFSTKSPGALARELESARLPPVVLRGDRLRIRLTNVSVHSPLEVTAVLRGTAGGPRYEVHAGKLRNGTTTLTTALPFTPAVLETLKLEPPDPYDSVRGLVTVAGIDVHGPGGWKRVDAALSTTGRWQFSGGPLVTGSYATATASGTGLSLAFSVGPVEPLTYSAYTYPTPMPVLTSSGVDQSADKTLVVAGLDSEPLNTHVVGTIPIPGASDKSVLVNRALALEASTTTAAAVHQVWVSKAAAHSITRGLERAGVKVYGMETIDQVSTDLFRAGPALALPLLVAYAGATVALAAGCAIAGLAVVARRRRYELAALLASGATPGTLRKAIAWEQLLALGLSVVAGIAAGLLATRLSLSAVPEFLSPPDQPTLHYWPSWLPLLGPLAVVVALVLVSAAIASLRLVAGVRTESLREDGR